MPDLLKQHPLAHKIPDSNSFAIPSLRRFVATETLAGAMYGEGSGFVGAFCAENADVPTWSKDVATYDRDAFHKDNPSKITRFTDVLTKLGTLRPDRRESRRAIAGCFPNFRHALDLWVKNGRKGPTPYSEQQDYGSCVNASFAALITALLGVRASNPLHKELFTFAAAWYVYANRGYCSDGWNMWGLAKVAYEIGIAFRQAYSLGSFSVDFTDDDKNEQICARTWCRSGVPKTMADHTQQQHPFEDGSMTEFDGGLAELFKVFELEGGINTGGTNTSGGRGWCRIGRVGPHEQCGYGADKSEECRKFAKDVAGVSISDDDFFIIMDQTWGEGFNGECPDNMWPVGVLADGKVLTMADANAMLRGAAADDSLALVWNFLADVVRNDTWGWGLKPQGAWVWKASDILRYFRGDIFAVLPLFKGVADPNPSPVPPPGPNPVPPGPAPGPLPPPEVIELTIPEAIPAGKYLLLRKPSI